MKRSEVIEILQQAIESRHQVKIDRDKINTETIHCIPLLLGWNLLMIRFLDDFQPDGYMFLRTRDITFARSGESERFSEMILEKEGILSQLKEPSKIDLQNWGTVFKSLQALGRNIIIECEGIEEGEFYIGKIVEVNNKSVSLLYFNGVGEWDVEPTDILYEEITRVSFDNRYINIMSKYLK